MIKTIFLAYFSCLNFAVQSDTSDCMQFLKEYYESRKNISFDEDIVYHFQFEVNLRLMPKSLVERPEDIQTSVESYTYGDLSVTESELFVIYQDGSEAIVVMHNQKTVYLMKKPEVNLDSIRGLIDNSKIGEAVISNGKISWCDEFIRGNRNLKRIRLSFNQEYIDSNGIDEAEFVFDLTSDNIYSITVYYHKNSEFLFRSMIYNEIDINYKDWKPQPIRSYVFDSSGGLISELGDYKVVRFNEE